MEVRNIICTLFFNRIEAPRNQIDELEKSDLSKYFIQPFNAQPVPNDAPPVLPRITASSYDGLYDLIISQVNVQLIRKIKFNLDDTFEEKLEQTKEIMLNLYSSIKKIYNQELLYFGANCIIDIDDENPVSCIKDKFIKGLNEEVCEINLRYSSIEDDKYYNNIMISNIKEYKLEIKLPKEQANKPTNIFMDTLSTSSMQETKHIIQLSIDVNDRYAYNCSNEYRTNESEINNVLNKVNLTVKTKINEFIGE